MFQIIQFICCIYLASAAHLPSNLNTCQISSPDFSDCLKSSLEDALLKLATSGIPELNLPPVDPFIPKSLTIKRTPGPISLDQTYTNLKFTGFSKSQAKGVKVEVKNECNLEIDLLLPEFIVAGHYVLKGQMLLFPMDAEGDMLISFKNARVMNKLTCEKFTKDAANYIKIGNSHMNFDFDEVTFNLGRIIPGNDQLDQDIHKVIEDDPRAFFEVMKPAALKMMESLYVDLANKVFTQVPTNEIFKD